MNMTLGPVPYEFSDGMSKDAVGLKYITAKNGNFEVRENNILQIVSKFTKELVDLPELKEGINYKLPKIPFSAFCAMLTFFRAVYKRDKTESSLFLFYNKLSSQYILWAPKQQNSTAASTYERGTDPEYLAMCTNNSLVMMAHSHPWKGTTVTPSGIDNTDEKDSILYLVVGNVEDVPNVYLSTCPGGERKKLPFFSFFENPILLDLASMDADSKVVKFIYEKLDPNDTSYIFKNYLQEVENPPEWLAKAKVKATPAATISYGGAKYVHGNYNIYDEYSDYMGIDEQSETYQEKLKAFLAAPAQSDTLADILQGAPKWVIDYCKAQPEFKKFLKEVV